MLSPRLRKKLRRFKIFHLFRDAVFGSKVYRLFRERTLLASLQLGLGQALHTRKPLRSAGRHVGAQDILRVGLIGAGRHARQILIPALRWIEGVELVATAVRTKESQRTLQTLGIPCARDYREVLDREDLDCVLISASTSLHRALVVEALRHGRPVFCETPGFSVRRDLRAVERGRARTSGILQYGYFLQYAPIYCQLQKILRSLPSEEKMFQVSFKALHHLCSLALFLNGPVTKVSYDQERDNYSAFVEYASGDRGHLVVTPPGPGVPSGLEAVTVKTGGREIVAEGGSVLREEVGGTHRLLGEFPFDYSLHFRRGELANHSAEAMAFLYQRGYIPELEAFFHSVRTGAPVSRDLQMAKSVFLLKEAVIRSFLRGTVSLSLPLPAKPS